LIKAPPEQLEELWSSVGLRSFLGQLCTQSLSSVVWTELISHVQWF